MAYMRSLKYFKSKIEIYQSQSEKTDYLLIAEN